MDHTHACKIQLDEWLLKNSGEPISNKLALKFYKEVQYHGEITQNKSVTARIRIMKLSIRYANISLMSILYGRNGMAAKGMRAGYVYAITNPAWPDYIKIGSAVDVYDRLNSYQTSAPNRDYSLERYIFVEDRLAVERALHNKFTAQGEWVKATLEDVNIAFDEYEVFPEKEMFIFALTEVLNLRLGHVDTTAGTKTVKAHIKQVLHHDARQICKLFGVDVHAFNDAVHSKGSIVSQQGKCYKLNFRNGILFEVDGKNLRVILPGDDRYNAAYARYFNPSNNPVVKRKPHTAHPKENKKHGSINWKR